MRSLGLCVLACTLVWPAVSSAQDSGGELEAGGLAPPSPMLEEPPEKTPTEAELERADQEDSGRGLEFVWLNGEIGYQNVSLNSVSTDNLVPALVKTQQDGVVYGGALGIRILVLTLGARFRFGNFEQWDMWSILGEAGLHVPLGDFEPYFTLGVGYASVGAFDVGDVTNLDSDAVDIRGIDVRAGIGFDYYLSSHFSVGAQASGDMMFLTRPGVDATNLGATPDSALAQDGTSTGLGFVGSALIGLHF